jgi:hypothetical protein
MMDVAANNLAHSGMSLPMQRAADAYQHHLGQGHCQTSGLSPRGVIVLADQIIPLRDALLVIRVMLLMLIHTANLVHVELTSGQHGQLALSRVE